jgi:hypothetical protein
MNKTFPFKLFLPFLLESEPKAFSFPCSPYFDFMTKGLVALNIYVDPFDGPFIYLFCLNIFFSKLFAFASISALCIIVG